MFGFSKYRAMFSKIQKGAKVGIFGTLDEAVNIKNELEKRRKDVEIVCFLDNYTTGSLEGLPIYLPIKASELDTVIISSFANQCTIRKMLNDLDIEDKKIIVIEKKMQERPDLQKIDARLKNIETHLSCLTKAAQDDAFSLIKAYKKLALEQTLTYITEHAPDILLLDNYLDVFSHIFKTYFETNKSLNGLFLEFGVYKGKSINFYSQFLPEQKFYGFDSFEGLPEDWWECKRSHFSLDGVLPKVNSNVELIKGWFDDTLPQFLETHKENVAFLHIDSDLYSSAKIIFDNLAPRIKAGTIIIFDEYFNYPNWQQHEFKAFQEFVKKYDVKYEYLVFGEKYRVAIKIC